MCGIVAIVGQTPVAPLIVDALKRLEYRGYDSAGVATVENGSLARRRSQGKLINLERRLGEEPLGGRIGIGHTRWATHGVPNETNAHPHFSNGVAIVHNGIIENFAELRAELMADGYDFASQTDTEVVAHLIAREIARGANSVDAAHRALTRLEGAFALAIMFSGDEDLIIGARNGPPLAIGHGEGEMFLGSDAIALAPFTNEITYLEDGDWAVVRRDRVTIYDMDRKEVRRDRQQSLGTSFMVDKGNHRHFMEKEIHEQPEVISHTLAHYIDFVEGTTRALDLPFDFKTLDRLAVSACGTAFLSGLIGKYWFERLARLPVDIDIASEFRYREMPIVKNSAALFISQSGETADTLASLRYCRKAGIPIGAIVNVRGSTIAREVRRHPAHSGRARDRRGVHEGFYLPALGACLSGRARRRRARGDFARKGKSAGARSSRRRRAMPARCSSWSSRSRRSPSSSRITAMCSISAATPTIRSPWKAR